MSLRTENFDTKQYYNDKINKKKCKISFFLALGISTNLRFLFSSANFLLTADILVAVFSYSTKPKLRSNGTLIMRDKERGLINHEVRLLNEPYGRRIGE